MRHKTRTARFRIAPSLGIPFGAGVFYGSGYGGSETLEQIGERLPEVLAYLRRSSIERDGLVIGYGLSYGRLMGE